MWSDTYSERNTVQYEKKKEDVLDYGLFTKGCHEKKKQNPSMSQINCFQRGHETT